MGIGMNTGCEGIRRKYDTGVFEKHVLDNGITVWLQKSPILTDEEGVLIAFLPNVGSCADPSDAHGTAHFFEHIPFRGTKGKPTTAALRSPVKERGGSLNASTNLERTEYSASLPREDFYLACETLYEMVDRPILSQKYAELECGAIQQEYRMRFSKPAVVRGMYFLKEFFGTHPFGHHPLGTLADIKKINGVGLREFHQRHYHGGNLHLLCGGSFAEIPSAMEELQKIFGRIRQGKSVQAVSFDDVPLRNRSKVDVFDPKCGEDTLRLIWKLPLLKDVQIAALDLLASSLGVGITSPIVKKLRVDRGLIYATHLFSLERYSKADLFSFDCPVGRQHFRYVEDTLFQTIRNVDWQDVVKRQRSNQLARKSSFTHPIKATERAVNVVTHRGRISSQHELEEIEDRLTIEDLDKWRKYLLKHPPFEMKFHASEKRISS